MNNSFRISSGAVSDRGLSEKRPQNEDSYLEMARCGIYAVADGVGGAQAGEVASQMAMEILAEAFTNRLDGDDAEAIMRTAIQRANAAIYQMAHELPQLATMATTVVALHLDGNIATIGHVGDSRLYRVDRDGNLYPETDDHSMVADEVRAGRMTAEQAENHPSRNIINRALGAEATVDVDLKTIMIDPGTAFLICSDGITRHVNDQEIKGVLTFGGEPDEICEYLKNLCYERGAEDNLTAVVVKVAAAEAAAQSIVPPLVLDHEEPTIATARPVLGNQVSDEDEDELLELETLQLPIPETTFGTAYDAPDDRDTVAIDETRSQGQPPAEPAHEVQHPVTGETPSKVKEEIFSMYGDPGTERNDIEKPGVLGKVAGYLAMLLLGAAIGLGVYRYVFPPVQPETVNPQLSVMRSENIPLSAFEENRRNVDKDPAGYVARFGASPQDSEDYYLLGRAYLLAADYPKARLALTEAQNKLSGADPVNAKVLTSDIAMALAVTNDTTIQSMLKKALAPAGIPSPDANTNTNR
jgi:serine/threonine protein phosphatase PrpC